jgi:DNA polymerase III subunit delta'
VAVKSTPESPSKPLPWQKSAWQKLHMRLVNGTLPHALLISGTAGIGKLHFARAFAALALCKHPRDTYACGECSPCHQLRAGAHPDYHQVCVLEDKTVIAVDQIRELSQVLALTSQHGGRKIALLSPADAMNANAANSLLKTLEEPPAGTLLLLVTARAARLAATIRSRCQLVHIATPGADRAIQWLQEQETRSDWPALLGIAGGGPLLALDLSKSDLIAERLNFYRVLLEMRSGRSNPISYAAEIGREDQIMLLRILQTWVADLIILATLGTPDSSVLINADALPLLQKALLGLNLRGLHALLNRLNEAVGLSGTSVNGQLVLEELFMDWSEGLQTLGAAPLAARRG